MARLDANILGAGKGKIGNFVVYTMHGKNYVRSKPTQYTDKKSDAQLAQRARMKTVTGFLSPFKELVRRTYAAEAVGRAPYHAAKSDIMRNAVQGEYPNFSINKQEALISKGNVPLPENVSVTLKEGSLLVEWTNAEEMNNRNGRDTLVLIAQD